MDATSGDTPSVDTLDKLSSKEQRQERRKALMKDGALIIALVVAVIIGAGLGIGLKDLQGWNADYKREIFYLKFPGQILMNMLKFLILPLMVSSLITATASLDKQASGRLGAAAMCYYLTTTFAAVILGIVLVLSIHPGDPDDLTQLDRSGSTMNIKPLDALLDLVRTCFPDNPVTMCFQREATNVKTVRVIKRDNGTVIANYTVDDPQLEIGDGMNVLGIVVSSLALGCVINHLKEAGRPLLLFFEALNAATMVLIRIVIWYSPIGILFLIAGKFVETDNIGAVAAKLGMYMVTVLAGLAIHSIITLPLVYVIGTRKNPAKFALGMMKSICTAWGTASSSATLPVTMECLVENNKIDERIVRFVVPIGATINMDGTALYEAVASIFIAQVNGINLGIANVIVVSLTSTAAAIGAAGVPQAGLVTMVIVLTSVNLPTEDVTLILAIDWFLDRFRTAVNVWGDAIGAGLLDHLFRNVFRRLDKEAAEAAEVDKAATDETETAGMDEKPKKLEAKLDLAQTNGHANHGYKMDSHVESMDTRF